MSSYKKTKSKRRPRQRSIVIDDHDPDLGPKIQSKLFIDDYEYLRSKIISTGGSEADLIRRWVRKGIKADRLERAAKDPVVNTLLKVVGNVLSGQLGMLERRLAIESHTLRKMIATTIVLANVAMGILETYTATDAPPEQTTLALRRKTFFNSLYQKFMAESETIMDGMLDERDGTLTLLKEKELISDIRDQDLESAIEELKGHPKSTDN